MDEERYEINSLLGKGRTGGVYAAEDTQMRRTVAVRRFYSAGGDTSSADWEVEFLTIAQNLGNLQGSNLLTVLDAGVDEDGAFLVSQLLEGQRLSEFVTKNPLDEHEAYEMASQLLDALALSHEAGFIHGALTAGSIMLTVRARGGYRYTIMDMGLSRLAPLIQGADSSYAMMADPALLAPELFDGEPATEVSDCYMLGHLVYLSLLGGHPFAFKSIEEVKDLHKSGALPAISDYREDITPAFVDWIKILTHCDISKRPQSAAEALKKLPKLPSKKSTTVVSPIAENRPTIAAPLLKKTAQPAKLQIKVPAASTNKPAAVLVTPSTPQPSARAPLSPAANRSVPAVATSSSNVLSAPQAKGKKKLILAITLPLLLIAGVSIAFMQPEGNETESFYQENSETKPINAKPEPTIERANERVSVPTPKPPTPKSTGSLSNGHSSKKRIVLGAEKIDWVVFNGPLRAWDKYRLPNSNFIQKPSLIGKAKASKKMVGNLFFLDSSEKQMRPSLYAESPDMGDGWKIKILNKRAGEPLILKLHFTSWNCNVKLRLLSADGKTKQSTARVFKNASKPPHYSSTQGVSLSLKDPPGSFFLELTTVEAKSENPSGLSLNFLMIE